MLYISMLKSNSIVFPLHVPVARFPQNKTIMCLSPGPAPEQKIQAPDRRVESGADDTGDYILVTYYR